MESASAIRQDPRPVKLPPPLLEALDSWVVPLPPSSLLLDDVGSDVHDPANDLLREEVPLGPPVRVLDHVAQPSVQGKPDVEVGHLLGQRPPERQPAQSVACPRACVDDFPALCPLLVGR